MLNTLPRWRFALRFWLLALCWLAFLDCRVEWLYIPGVKPPASDFPADLYLMVSMIGAPGGLLGYWVWATGWDRHQHWGDGAPWGISAIVGLWSAFCAFRRSHDSWRALAAALLSFLHVFSLLGLACFWLFLLGSFAVGCIEWLIAFPLRSSGFAVPNFIWLLGGALARRLGHGRLAVGGIP